MTKVVIKNNKNNKRVRIVRRPINNNSAYLKK